MKRLVYNVLFALVYPFLLPGFLVRMLRRGGYAARMGDRFALYPAGLFKSGSAPVWIHAVSVGEVQVAGQLMREWRAVEPGVRFCFSTTSSTGWKMAEREVGPDDTLIYNPLDFPNFVKSALKTVRPRAVVLTESEIWPNFIWTANRFGIPLFLINARVSDRSAPRYRAARFFFGDVLSRFARIFAQSDLDADRLRAAGAPADRVEVTGSFKFDVAHRNEPKERELAQWLAAGGAKGKVMLGGSTWPGEDEALLKIFAGLKDRFPGLALVIAPRHFEKADAVEANIRSAGFACVRRSKGASAHSASPVFLADTTGELMGLYGLADAVFVGKSLCAHGSQNMIEPCLCGKPTAVGPYTENFRPVMSDLLSANAIVQVPDADALGRFFADALADGSALGARAAAAVGRRRGVVPKCVAAIRGALAALAVLVFVAGCGKEEPKKAAADEEQHRFHPTLITTACITAVENPSARTVRLADAAAETYRPFLDAFGLACVSNTVTDASADVEFFAGFPKAADLKRAFARLGEGGILAWRIDVKGMDAATFKSAVESFPCPAAHFWMPGMEEWLLVGGAKSRTVPLDAMMDVFARESAFEFLAEAQCTALSDLFASYVGTVDGLADAFHEEGMADVVRPEFFVTTEIPPVAWIVRGEVDEDIAAETFAEMRSMQVIRRLILEGNMAAGRAKSEEATDAWSRAMRRNPRDPMLLDRLDRLSRNAGALLRVGNVGSAAKCFETMILIHPTDAAAVFNYGTCLQRLGKKDMAEQVFERAKELRK